MRDDRVSGDRLARVRELLAADASPAAEEADRLLAELEDLRKWFEDWIALKLERREDAA